jgi:hypothetical protein
MKNSLFIWPLLLFILLSCQNKEVLIKKAEKNCNCIEKLQEGVVTTQFCQSLLVNCDIDPFSKYSDTSSYLYKTKEGKNNYKIFAQTSTMELVNTSKTKVYNVWVQIDNEGNVSYEQHVMEPTSKIALGCDSNFAIKYNHKKDIIDEKDCYDAIQLSNLSKTKIKYTIHKVDFISEY